MALKTGGASQEPEIALDEAASSRALDAIRRDALDGLLALPRVGMGVGGFLTGVRRENVIQILDRVEIPCLHALGPGFLLTSEELENARNLLAKAEPVQVLGMYISKTRGAPEPGPADLETFASLCLGEGQLLLMIRPSTVEPVRATLFTREQDGQVSSRLNVRMDAVMIPVGELEMAAERPQEAAAPNLALQALKLSVVPGEPVNVGQLKTGEAIADGDNNDGARAPDSGRPPGAASPRVEKEPEVYSTLPPRRHTVLFQEPQQESPRRAVLYTFTAVALITAAAFAALDMLAPKPELTLNIREENGALVFRWNRNAAAGADRGRLLVNDAGQLNEFPLDAARIEAGFFQYRRKSDQIVAKIVFGDRSARAMFFGNSPQPGASRSASRPQSETSGERHTN